MRYDSYWIAINHPGLEILDKVTQRFVNLFLQQNVSAYYIMGTGAEQGEYMLIQDWNPNAVTNIGLRTRVAKTKKAK